MTQNLMAVNRPFFASGDLSEDAVFEKVALLNAKPAGIERPRALLAAVLERADHGWTNSNDWSGLRLMAPVNQRGPGLKSRSALRKSRWD